MIEIHSVSEVTAYISKLLAGDAFLQNIWITGEASNVRHARSGHWYFTLKDKDAEIRCVMWGSVASRQVVAPQEGQAFNAHGSVSVYQSRGEYQLVIDILRSAGAAGDLYQQFELLKAKLAEEGLFDAERKRALPPFPQRIGIVTSPDAAAFQDVLNVLRRRYPLAEVVLSPSLVQGIDAPPMIVRAIERINQRGDIDVLIICRGGGSIEDLWAFNDERVARAVAASHIPVISGVGHETDNTIVDFVADVRAPTPSAAAEIATPHTDEIRASVQMLNAGMQRRVTDGIKKAREGVSTQERALRLASPVRSIAEFRQRVDEYADRIQQAQRRYANLLAERLSARQAALEAANPDAILKRGYAIVHRTDDNSPVMDASAVTPGTGVRIRLRDGQLLARIEDEETHGQYKRTLF